MKLMRWFAILMVFFIFSFGCTENKKQETISYKDIEGYWVSGYLLHNTDLTRSIASGNEKKPKVLLLRLKNSVNGFADTSYKIHADTLLYRAGIKRSVKQNELVDEEEFYPFQILFYSKDRLILKDDVTNEEMTFYNLSIVPESQDNFKRIAFGKKEIIINDSIEINEYSMLDEKFYLRKKRMAINDTWKNELNMIIHRIDWNAGLFTKESDLPQRRTAGEFEIMVYNSSGHVHIALETSKHFGEWDFHSKNVSDPAMSALLEEMRTFEAYYFKKDILIIEL